MKSCLSDSYYMGISYRPIHRPDIQFININSMNTFHITLDRINQDEDQTLRIHKNKKRRIKQLLKNHNPFLTRKLQQERKKKKQSGKIHGNTQGNENLIDILKVCKIKTEGDQPVVKQSSEQTMSLILPEKDIFIPKKKQSNQQIKHVNKKNIKQDITIKSQQSNVFNHFPSSLLLKTQKNKKKSYFTPQKKPYTPSANRNCGFFFPSNRVKVGHQNLKLRKESIEYRPRSSTPYHKHSLEYSKSFNFDGTLQNHKILIPQRPMTAAIPRKKQQRKYSRELNYSNYQTIAKNCIKLKNVKKIQKCDRGLNIQPWGTQNEQKNLDLLDLSCSSIGNQK